MAINYKVEERRVIPNWRDFSRTIKLRELSDQPTIPITFKSNLPSLIKDWRENPSIGKAADLINHSFIFQKFDIPELKEASDFIMSHGADSSKSLLEVAYQINRGIISDDTTSSRNIIELNIGSISEFEKIHEDHKIHKQLNRLRKVVSNQMYNAILWVELSRLYSFFGNKAKAERTMTIALQLAPSNRYVLRSATRMFIHFEEHEKALFYLKKVDGIENDPWLVSTHIATSSLLNRYSRLIKPGQQLASSTNLSDYELSELRSSLLTLEYSEGSNKQAKKYFSQALRNPNDNSLAQLEWLSHQDKIFAFEAVEYKTVVNAFEALAFDSFRENEWESTIDHCVYWFLDMPYSKRPIMLGSYVACMLRKDYATAISLCKAGLKANPSDATILNNLAYSLLMSNELEDAEKYIYHLATVKFDTLSETDRTAIQATLGLAAFRLGKFAEGQKFYEIAISNAKRFKNREQADLALLIYFGELMRAGIKDKTTELYPTVREISPASSTIIAAWKEQILNEYNLFALK